MNNRIKFLEFNGQNAKRSADERPLIGVVQGTDGMGGASERVYDCFESPKPTYYLNASGKEVSYIEHAEFIEANSFETGFQSQRMRFYPMLRFEAGDKYNIVHLEILYYERKPFVAPKSEEVKKLAEHV